MKLRFTGKQIVLSTTLLLALLGGAMVAFLPGEDPMLQEIEAYAIPTNALEITMNQQLAAIQAGASVDTADAGGYTPLMNAARLGRIDIVDYLLIKGARLHLTAPNGMTAAAMAEKEEVRRLLQACALAEKHPTGQEQADMRRKLEEAGINPANLTQALFEAVENWRNDSVQLTAQVLALGGNANAVNTAGEHILQVEHEHPGSMVLLLRLGANPNATLDNQGGSLPLLKNMTRHPRNVQNLLTAGASAKGALALAKAAGKGNAELTRQMLAHGADAAGVAANGKTALEHAVQGLGNPRTEDDIAGISVCVKLLLEAGARTEYTTPEGKLRSPISPGGMSILPECLRLLVDAGADVNALNSRGANYAQIAAYKPATSENLKLIHDIVDAGGNLQHVDDHGETFLFYALPGICSLPVTDPVDSIREEAIELLEEMLELISDSRPDPAALDRNGNTALHLAVIRRGTADDRVVEYLLKMGVDPAVRNKFGRTALEAMLRNPCGPRSKYVARLLTAKGPMPTEPGLQLVLASMTDDTATIRQLLRNKPSQDLLAVALGCVQNATAADLLLKAGAPGYYENMAYMVRYGNPDVVRIFARHKKLDLLAPHWSKVRTEAMAKAFVEAGLMPETAEDIANERVLGYLLTLPQFNTNGTPLNLATRYTSTPWLPSLVQDGRSKMTRQLLEHKVAVNGYAESPLALAHDADIAEMLIDYGADLTWRAPSGDTLLSHHKARLRQLAKGYKESPTKTELEEFREHYAIVQMLEDAGVSDIHPQKEAIKRELQRGNMELTSRVLHIVTPDWQGPVLISEDAMVMARSASSTDAANVLSIGPDCIKYKWDRWGYGYAVLREDGNFHEVQDEERYRDFKKTPAKVPHYFIDFINEKNKQTRLYLHPDLMMAVRGDTGAAARVKEMNRGSYGSIQLDWEKGGSDRFVMLNRQLHILNAETAKKMLQQYYPGISYSKVQLVADEWQDTLYVSRDFMVAARATFARDTARVLVFNDQKITLKWDKWGEESFVKQQDGKYHLYSAAQVEAERIRRLIRERDHSIRVKAFTFSASEWQDTVLISFKHKVAVRSGGAQDAATVVRYDKGSITLKWDRWAEENFVKQQDGTYRSTK